VSERAGRLRVLVANQSPARLTALAAIVQALGHETIAAELDVATVAAATSREHPDVALVGVGRSSDHALQLITQIVSVAECPVIAIMPISDVGFVREAARRGIFAYVVDSERDALESALEIVLLRFGEYHGLEGAFGRRATIERAKGILMERHAIGEQAAFAMLRDHSRQSNRMVVEIASAVIGGYLLLRPQ
jgi:AmiR/NasT family two-component response regulator